MITFDCPTCSETYAVPDDKAGKSARCKKCGEVVTVPGLPEPARLTGLAGRSDTPKSVNPHKLGVSKRLLALPAAVVLGFALLALLKSGCDRPDEVRRETANKSAAYGLSPEQNAARLAPIEARLREAVPPGFTRLSVFPHDTSHDLAYTVVYQVPDLGFHHDEVFLAVKVDGMWVRVTVYDRMAGPDVAEFEQGGAAGTRLKRVSATDAQWAWALLTADAVVTATLKAVR